MAGIFKAYDVRGIYPTELDESTARKIGQAFRKVLDADEAQYASMQVAAASVAAEVSWPAIASIIADEYRSVLAKRHEGAA